MRVVNLPGDVFNVTAARFQLKDLEITVVSSVARTGAIGVANATGATQGAVTDGRFDEAAGIENGFV